MSMSKTAAGAAVGALLCDGRLKSLDDRAGDHSNFLKTTPYRDVSIRNLLQMNSGLTERRVVLPNFLVPLMYVLH